MLLLLLLSYFENKFLMINIGDDSSGADVVDGECEEPSPSCGDYVMHFLTLFWKIIFAFIPPTGKTQQN